MFWSRGGAISISTAMEREMEGSFGCHGGDGDSDKGDSGEHNNSACLWM